MYVVFTLRWGGYGGTLLHLIKKTGALGTSCTAAAGLPLPLLSLAGGIAESMVARVTAIAAAVALASPALAMPLAAPLLQSATAAGAAAAAAVWLRLQSEHRQGGEAKRVAGTDRWVGAAISAMEAARTTAADVLSSAGMSIAATHSVVTAAATAALTRGLPLGRSGGPAMMAGEDDWTMDGASYIGGWSRAAPDTQWEEVPTYDDWMERLNGVRDSLEKERSGLIDKRADMLRTLKQDLREADDSRLADELERINERVTGIGEEIISLEEKRTLMKPMWDKGREDWSEDPYDDPEAEDEADGEEVESKLVQAMPTERPSTIGPVASLTRGNDTGRNGTSSEISPASIAALIVGVAALFIILIACVRRSCRRSGSRVQMRKNIGSVTQEAPRSDAAPMQN